MEKTKYLFVSPMLFKILRLIFVLGGSLSIVLIFMFEFLGYTNVSIVDWSLAIGFFSSLVLIVGGEVCSIFFNSKDLGVHPFVYLTAKYYLEWSNEYMHFIGNRFDEEYCTSVQNRTKTK